MSRTLIIADVHNKCHVAEHIIKCESPDFIVFLGDYWDSYEECFDDVRNTSEWFSWSINQKNRTHCSGNHDIPYWFPENSYLDCPGFSRYKLLLVEEKVKKRDFEKLVFYYNLDDKWLLSHAGIHPYWTDSPYSIEKPMVWDMSSACKFLEKESEKFLIRAGRNQGHWFVAWSRARSNTLYPGGLLWNDFNGDFHTILGLNQIVGHTYFNIPQWIFRDSNDIKQNQKTHKVKFSYKYGSNISYNLCLDTGLKYYAIWDGIKLDIKRTEDLIKK